MTLRLSCALMIVLGVCALAIGAADESVFTVGDKGNDRVGIAADSESPLAHPESKDWEDLFSPDLSNAVTPEGVWTFANGELTANEDEVLWSDRDYENFVLDLEFKNAEETNSGVIVYCTDVEDWVPGAIEIQIADDHAQKWAESPKSWQCGAIFGHLPATKSMVKQPGAWNRLTIRCIGKHIDVTLNDEHIISMNLDDYSSATLNPDGSEVPPWLTKPKNALPTKGRIGLQGKHGNAPVWFRNIKIKSEEAVGQVENKASIFQRARHLFNSGGDLVLAVVSGSATAAVYALGWRTEETPDAQEKENRPVQVEVEDVEPESEKETEKEAEKENIERLKQEQEALKADIVEQLAELDILLQNTKPEILSDKVSGLRQKITRLTLRSARDEYHESLDNALENAKFRESLATYQRAYRAYESELYDRTMHLCKEIPDIFHGNPVLHRRSLTEESANLIQGANHLLALAQAAADPSLRFQITGIIMGEAGKSVVSLFDTFTGVPMRTREGDDIGGWKVTEIRDKTVVLKREGAKSTLTVK